MVILNRPLNTMFLYLSPVAVDHAVFGQPAEQQALLIALLTVRMGVGMVKFCLNWLISKWASIIFLI